LFADDGIGSTDGLLFKMKRFLYLIAMFPMLYLLCGCAGSLWGETAASTIPPQVIHTSLYQIEDKSTCTVTAVPDRFGFDPFYEKYCDAGGIPIISSEKVDDLALQQAYRMIMNMLAPIPEVRRELVANGAYYAVIGRAEKLRTLPEYSILDESVDYRGLGGSKNFPITSSAEENLLCLTWDIHYGESITVHEFAHTISLMGLGDEFDALLEEFTRIYDAAIQQGLWQDTYAGSDILEYWAEGVQSYFNTNLEAIPTDGVHNHVNTREELAEYDPALYEFISRIFKNYQWTPSCPPKK
jgi:hypothetical protein